MVIQVTIHGICTQEDLDTLLKDSGDAIKYDYTKLADGTFDTYAVIKYNKCSLIRYFALKNYAKKHNDYKITIKKIKE